MSTKRKAKPDPLKLIELQCAVIQHCAALKAVTELIGANKIEAAVARLDQAVAALHAVVRGQCVGVTMECPKCGSKQDVVQWVDDGACSECGGVLEVLG